ncbi:leucine-rich repeat and WD repeat-containing protein 1 isoform X2 [Canis lupus familiaris]|uniref:leucine-rich repeat and WD repeat-containing protein 1 isoform X2 n=1 Tax=Canis lupus familiaris TaxID=9615 RepID=UPI0003AD7EAD|nr:leucine-rich repeat and WD repeat-containing protein 1 isoform X2 [Canis lupus familiaris]XP_038395102.1 leucine-rich repeat and WD repeat-containing protein 1 isoform X2 [Canis lupus familiaris]|eukprot:XP_005621049.1 leucine-rich repeat and WD repeat-containing protein 1 isoform X2 [Canis lupus familiaris]
MGPLSARLLMQRGRPKSDRLGKIRSLDLSGLKLLSEHLDPKLLSRLKQLQELDLSNNQLETLPANLGLSHLRVLRCANNQLGDVTALCQFPQLEELSLEGNPFLTVTAHWEKFKAALSPEEAEKAQADFVRSAVRDVRYGPESLSEFTQWRVRMISEELVASGGIQVREADVPERPPKATAAREPRAKPVALKRPDDTPLSLSPNKRVCTSSSSAHVEGSDGSQPTLEPLHFLQCHSKNNSPRDLETQLWACAFEPAWEEGQAGATSQTVATCGGEAVCVIDCQTGIVLHKYKAPGEEFFSVAWTALTVVTQAGHKKRWSVLAAAGLRGLVRLLHVRAGFCCGVIRAHKKAIATLCFSPTHETHLFTASYDKRIILWDLGVPNHDYEFQASQLLTLDTASIPLRLCPVASCPDTYLLAGCEGGCCCWDVRLDQPQKRRVCEVEFVFSEGAEAAGRRVDGLAFVNEDVVASKGNSLGTICLWSWSQTWMGRGKQSTLAVVVLARLQWSPTKLAYFSLSTCPDEGIVLCGDEEGNVWVYDVRHILTQPPPRPAAPQAPTQILKWPQPWALGQMVTKTMVNTVVANPTFTYLTALTDSNIVAIWKRQ